MTKNFLISILTVFLMLPVIGCQDDADKNINSAKVLLSIGEVNVKDSGQWKPVVDQMTLTEGSEIKTGPQSQCNIVIGTDSFITIKEKSHMTLQTLFKDVTGIENNTIELKFGKSVLNPTKLLKGDSFRVKTPTAIAAVRGTRFTVQTAPKGEMKVAVVDGKVELTRRIPALEKLEESVIEDSKALTTLKEKVEQESIVVDANETALIDNTTAEEDNKAVEEAVKKHVEEIKKEIAVEKDTEDPDPDKAKEIEAEVKAAEMKQEQEMSKALAALAIMKKEKEATSIKVENKVHREDREDVKELDKAIEEAKEQKKVVVIKKEEKTVLTINSPIKGSKIYVNSRMVGTDSITLNPKTGVELSIKVEAKGFEKYREKVTLKKGDKKEINVEFIERARLTIVSPVKNSKIYVNSKYKGNEKVTIQPGAGKELKIEVVANGFEKYSKKVTLKHGEKRELRVDFTARAQLTVISPVRNGKIYINSKYRGSGKVTVWPAPGKNQKIEVAAYGFKKFKKELVLKTGEKQVVKAAMEKNRQLDRVKWSEKLGSTVMVNPVYYKNYLVVATNDGYLVTLNRNGKKVWRINLKRRIESTPVISQGKVFAVTTSGDFYSIQLASGRILWKKKIFGSLLFGSKPLVVKNKIFVATSYGRVYAFSSAGKELWHKDIENGIYSSPAYKNGMLYVGAEDQRIYAISERDGDIDWTFKTDSRMVSSSPIISGESLYVGCYSGSFFAVNIRNGKLKWKYKTGDSVFSTPVVHKNMVFFGSNDGNIYAVSTGSGKLAWKFNTQSKVTTKPSILKGIVYVTSGKNIHALDVKKGKMQWVHKFDKNVKTSATLVGNDIYIGLESGEVAAVRNSLIDVYK